MQEKPQKQVPLDYFLYSCLEAEKTSTALPSESARRIAWPMLKDRSEGLNQHKLEELVEQLFQWYFENYPELSSTEPVTMENVVSVTTPIVSLTKDLSALYRVKMGGEDLPKYETNHPMIDAFWVEIDHLIDKHFGLNGNLYKNYMHWSYAKKTDSGKDNFSRPPVGRFAPRGHSRQGGDRQRGDRQRSGGSPRERAGRHGFGGGRPRRFDEPKKDSLEMEQAAMADCEQAFEKLRSNPDIDKVMLKPQNSFYRRIQHTKAKENGFISESSGEGRDRAVVIARKEEE